jgi:hypothetical protein
MTPQAVRIDLQQIPCPFKAGMIFHDNLLMLKLEKRGPLLSFEKRGPLLSWSYGRRHAVSLASSRRQAAVRLLFSWLCLEIIQRDRTLLRRPPGRVAKSLSMVALVHKITPEMIHQWHQLRLESSNPY